jgi:hypothetical protein
MSPGDKKSLSRSKKKRMIYETVSEDEEMSK